jgi:hypothetical protein
LTGCVASDESPVVDVVVDDELLPPPTTSTTAIIAAMAPATPIAMNFV